MGIDEIRGLKSGKPKEKKKPTRIRSVSIKRQALNRNYNPAAKKFREENPRCKILSEVCTGETQGVHHTKGRGKYLMAFETWMPACNPCNEYCESHTDWAKERGFKISKFS